VEKDDGNLPSKINHNPQSAFARRLARWNAVIGRLAFGFAD
jgi:hypothetical protein